MKKVDERNGIFLWISFKQPTVIDIALLLCQRCRIWMLLGVWRGYEETWGDQSDCNWWKGGDSGGSGGGG